MSSRAAEQVAMTTLNASSRKCPGGTVLGNDLAWNDNFWVKEEGLKDGERERRGDRVWQGEKEQEDAITEAEDPRKAEEEKGREDLRGKQTGSEEDPNGDTDTARSNEEVEKEGESRGSFGIGGDWRPARKEDTAKEPHHVPGGVWLYKVGRFFTSNVPVAVKGH
ncbi:hypothetical protein NDU88_006183 [Pleurodeles waltl]|uniref:Uncharacterized protein n=1 Tax=Pleurodeles waltl TaxID=8319 RepID=A0AAV7NXD3_PLEWA|nr:hypothetical protein NDU88_006183 [Pleurodeles waltl]